MNLMTLHGVLFLNVLTFLVSHELFIEGKECKQDDLCSCSFDDGRKVDISSLGNTDGTPRISTECDVFPQEKDLCTRFMKHREREALEVFLMNLVHRSFSCGKTSHSVDIRLTYRVDNASMADYDSDEILPQALDLFEDQENCITQNKERFADVKSSKDGNIYSYNPCKPFKEASCTNDAAACVQDPTKTQSVQIGDASKAAFKYDKESGNVVVGYTSGTFSDLRLTQVIFVCDQSAKEPVFTAQGEEQGGEFQLTVTSVCACPDGCTGSSAGISGGTIILIAFFSSLVLYFSIGIVVQKAVRKKEGKELIPNSAFWFGVPSNIKAGFIFLLGRCIPRFRDVNYDSI